MKALGRLSIGGTASIPGKSSLLAHPASASSYRSTQRRLTHRRHLQTQGDRLRSNLPGLLSFKRNDVAAFTDAGPSTSGHLAPPCPPLAHDFFSPHRHAATAPQPRTLVAVSPSSRVQSSSASQPPPPEDKGVVVSDHEFEVRLGRAVSLLRATLGDFMRIGLVDYDTSHVSQSSSNSGLGFPSLDRLGLGAILHAFGATARAKEKQRESLPPHLRTDADCPVYHPDIVFKFHPPVASTDSSSEESLASHGSSDAGPASLLTFSGRTMYFGSAHILRHALSALFSETNVVIERVKLHRDPSVGREEPTSFESTSKENMQTATARREASLVLRLSFTGVVRVTQQVQDYTVIFRYKFDPSSGMIIEHDVDKIEPAPGKKIWAGLASAFSRLAGFPQQPNPAASPCHQTNRASDKPTSLREGYSCSESTEERVPQHGSPLRYIFAPVSVRRSPASRDGAAHRTPTEWQGRRSYGTQRRSNSTSATSEVAPQQPQYFSRPRSAEDMPGPSLASIWVPSYGMTRDRSATEASQETVGVWAPPSNDPSLVTVVPNKAAAPIDVTQYRPVPAITLKALPKVISGLSKSNLTILVTLTGMAGYALCPSALAVSSSTSFLGPVGTLLAFATGTALCSGAANAINQLREIPYDAQMARTRNRVLPSRTITPLQAATFAGVSSVGGIATLAMLNPLTSFLGLANIVLYAFIYTPMKRRNIANTWVGAVVGALPPLMGWAACTGTLTLATDAPAWCLAALLFAWQFPHFNSLSHNLSSEYARGGYRMMSVVNPALNRRTSLRYSLLLVPICSLALPASGAVAALPYALLSLPPNLILIHAAYKFWKRGNERSARWCFWVSLIHLPAVMILAMATKKSLWDALSAWIRERFADEGQETIGIGISPGGGGGRRPEVDR